MKKKPVFWNVQTTALVNSFNRIPRKKFFYSALFDFLCLLAFFIILTSAFGLINLISFKSLEGLNQAYELKMSGDEEGFTNLMAELTPDINRLFIFSLIIFVIAFIILMFFCSWFYGKAWCKALNKKFNPYFLKQYFKLNFVWFIIWLFIFLFTVSSLKVSYAAVILLLEILIFFYLDYILRSVFDEENKLSENFAALFNIAKHVLWFLLFLIISIVMLFILLYILALTTSIPVLFIIVFIILLIFFIGWSRNYIVELVKHVRLIKKV